MKKQYTMPSMKVHTVKPATMICGSGDVTSTMGSGSGNAPSTTTQNGNTGIFCDSKGGSWFNDEE